MTPVLTCTRCKSALPEQLVGQPAFAPCPSCGALIQVEVFPALFRPAAQGRDGELVVGDGEASCFNHPQKRATVPCGNCGRFLCALCDCDLQGQHLCPACLESGRVKGRIKNLQNQRTLYDSIALTLSLLPLIIFYFTIITAPIAIYVAIRYWKAPLSIVRRSRVRLVLAMIFAGLEIGGWGTALYFLIRA